MLYAMTTTSCHTSTRQKLGIALASSQVWCHGGHFKAHLLPPNHCFCPPPQARIEPRKKVTGPMPLDCILGAVPPNIFKTLLFFFWSSPLNLLARSEIPTIEFCCAPSGNERALPSKTCAPKKINGQVEDLFLVLPLENEGKID